MMLYDLQLLNGLALNIIAFVFFFTNLGSLKVIFLTMFLMYLLISN